MGILYRGAQIREYPGREEEIAAVARCLRLVSFRQDGKKTRLEYLAGVLSDAIVMIESGSQEAGIKRIKAMIGVATELQKDIRRAAQLLQGDE